MIEKNKTYYLSTRYDGTNYSFFINGITRQMPMTGKLGAPASSTIFAIGANTVGSDAETSATYNAKSNMEVYSVRIYNRSLTQEEVQHNYEVDKARFNL